MCTVDTNLYALTHIATAIFHIKRVEMGKLSNRIPQLCILYMVTKENVRSNYYRV